MYAQSHVNVHTSSMIYALKLVYLRSVEGSAPWRPQSLIVRGRYNQCEKPLVSDMLVTGGICQGK